ncbi:hypothetical protein PIIN_11559 [Serendipita indica DSM 11827]|uniref:Uncharacterized protein n=1 Tax=Serendipita indica (strain DSM 11827) TaxID=1109443 RepID=G4U1Y9_SERID|nr:hypothetical protein PIIN_11559 [Serendipita indica DSM 11827]
MNELEISNSNSIR